MAGSGAGIWMHLQLGREFDTGGLLSIFYCLVFFLWFYKKRGTRSNAQRSAEPETENPFGFSISRSLPLIFSQSFGIERGFLGNHPDNNNSNNHLGPCGIQARLALILSLASSRLTTDFLMTTFLRIDDE
jgi:hypothetical protein